MFTKQSKQRLKKVLNTFFGTAGKCIKGQKSTVYFQKENAMFKSLRSPLSTLTVRKR